MAKEMPGWAELEQGILVLIARCLNLIEDYLSFGTVCKSWHSVATKSNFNSELPRVPWLMLPEEEDDDGGSYRKFFSLYNGMILKKRIPKASGKRCMESMGWLITVKKEEGEISLLHPFSGVLIELPNQNTIEDYSNLPLNKLWNFFEKAVLSASPSHTSDFVLVVIDGGSLCSWRQGDLRWTSCEDDSIGAAAHVDVVYFNGYFYAIDALGHIILYDIEPQRTRSHIITRIPCGEFEQIYIVESQGSLFVVSRNGVDLRDFKHDCGRIQEQTYGMTKFRVFQIDLAAGKATRTRELGDRAFFLGYNASLSVQASQFPGIKPNHIYYTDDLFESFLTYTGSGWDMGVFNLENGSIQQHYKGVSSCVCPPIWVTPTLY